MENRHKIPAGEHFLHQTDSACACKPIKKPIYKGGASGRGGRHQGYTTIRVEWTHNAYPLEEAENV